MANEIPAEIAELRDRHETAIGNLAMAEGAAEAAVEELATAAEKANEAAIACQMADKAEEQARRAYIDALRRHGYVQTADGPKPAEVQS